MKAKIYFLAMAFVALLMVGCSDDDGIQLTQDEIIGDINTGKQVGIKGNSLVRALKKVPNFKLHSLFLNFNSCPRSISSFKSEILFWTGI